MTSQPSATFGDDGPVGEGSTATVAFTDQADAGPGARFTYSYDFDGDGTFDVVDSASATAEVPADLTADGPATVTVTGRIANQFGGDTDLTTDVEVTSVAPTVTLAGDAAVVAGTSYGLAVTSTDPSAADEAAPLATTIDWGDGVVDDATTNRTRAVEQGFTHVYQPGTYTITVVVTDADGAESDPATLRVTATAPVVPTTSTTTSTVPGSTSTTSTTGPSGTGPGDGGTGGTDLPRTGSDPRTPVAVGLALLLGGLGSVAAARRRRRTA